MLYTWVYVIGYMLYTWVSIYNTGSHVFGFFWLLVKLN